MSHFALFKRFIFINLMIMIFLFGAFAFYDIFYFMPYKAEIEAMISKSDPEDRVPPESIKSQIEATHKNGISPSAVVARELLNKLKPTSGQRALSWQLDFALWDLLVRLHISRHELYGLYCALAYNGDGYGANQLSLRHFFKPLSKLTDEEAAIIISILGSPNRPTSSP